MIKTIDASPSRPWLQEVARAGLSLAGFASALSAAVCVSAQDRGGLSDWQAPTLRCEPACRSGYECRRGECLPICSPPCENGLLCSAGGTCVEAESGETPPLTATPPRWSAPSHVCSPACRSGYTCMSNRCVSLCNPVCPAGERCTANGECIPALSFYEPARQPPPDDPPPEPRDPHADAIANLHLDALGALQFGIAPALELGKVVSGYVRLRVLNTGLASYFVLGRDSRDDLRWGLGVALGLHVFSAERGNMRGWYGGLALEYAYLETRDTTRDFATYRTLALVPQIDVGHRWGFGGLLIGVSFHLGLAIPLQNRATAFGDDGCRRESSCVEKYSVAFIPSLALDIGWFIPNGDATETSESRPAE